MSWTKSTAQTNCNTCRYKTVEGTLVRCALGMFKPTDLREELDNQRDVTLSGSTYYRVGTLHERHFDDGMELMYDRLPSKPVVEDIMVYWEKLRGNKEYWRYDIPKDLYDEEETVDPEAFAEWAYSWPHIVQKALLGIAWSKVDYETYGEFIEHVLNVYPADNGYEMKSVGGNATAVLMNLDEHSCIYGLHIYDEEPFYRVMKEEGLYLRPRPSITKEG